MKRVKITTEDFITKAKEVHGDKYDYSNVEYVNTNVKVCIICPEHGEFCQSPHGHLRGRGCPKCGANKSCKSKTSTTEIFIEKARKIHGDKYDYSKVNYINNHTKVCIVCPEHGEFWQSPHGHLRGRGCPKCGANKGCKSRTCTTEIFIEKARKIHGDKYDYSKVNYINNCTKVCIICPEHGEFWQTPGSHTNIGNGCPLCGNKNSSEKRLKSINIFIKQAKEIHGDKYDYSKVEYSSNHEKVIIICPEHGEFLQSPYKHLQGHGCPKCAKSGVKLTTEDFLKKAKEVHGDKYDYSKVEYINNNTNVCIICPEHGEFWQTPRSHLAGNGCSKCNASKMELEIKSFLEDNNIKYIPQHSFDWLKYKSPLKLDFYLPEYNIAIECQGEQHFCPIDFFGGEQRYELTVKRDIAKLNLCKEHNINILYFANENVSVPKKWEHYKVIKSLDKLLKKIYK